MRIPAEKELSMKKAILKAIENGESPAKLAPSFGVSKSTIYKYRRALRNQGFIKKNENDIYVITQNKFSTKPQIPETADLEFDYKDEPMSHQKDLDSLLSETDTKEISDTVDHNDNNAEIRLQSKIDEIRQANSAKADKGIFKKILNRFKKKNNY
jgi:predicted transcriptional regulator